MAMAGVRVATVRISSFTLIALYGTSAVWVSAVQMSVRVAA